MGRGNGAYKISSIYLDHEIPHTEAKVGDMVINKVNGQWDRIKEFKEKSILTKHDKEYMIDEVIVVRY